MISQPIEPALDSQINSRNMQSGFVTG